MVKPLVIKTCVKRNSRFLTRFLFQLIQRPPARGPFSLPSLGVVVSDCYSVKLVASVIACPVVRD
jgi:hypothetical protein